MGKNFGCGGLQEQKARLEQGAFRLWVTGGSLQITNITLYPKEKIKNNKFHAVLYCIAKRNVVFSPYLSFVTSRVAKNGRKHHVMCSVSEGERCEMGQFQYHNYSMLTARPKRESIYLYAQHSGAELALS